MKINPFSILFLFLSLIFIAHGQNYTLYLLSQERGAACLDGSPVGLYVHEGVGEDRNNFMVYFDSGGFCGAGSLADTLESCYQRSFGSLGSTKKSPPFKNFDNDGLLSTNPEVNPLFYNWTKVFAIYCDGAQYFGNRSQPIEYKDQKLHFRGTPNVLEQVQFLQDKFDMFRKNKIVVTGVSAGGIATYLYSNHFLAKSITSKVFSIPDSGLFLTDYYSPLAQEKIIRQMSKALIQLAWEQDTYPLTECINDWNNDVIQCFNAVNLVKYIKTPMLIIQSAYDQWSILNILGAGCLKNKSPPYSLQNCSDPEIKAINDYRDATRQGISSMLKTKQNTGVWSPSCVQHGFTDDLSFNSPNYKVPSSTGKSMVQSIRQFLENPQKPPIDIDSVNWPDNKGCNGIQPSFMHNLRGLRKQLF